MLEVRITADNEEGFLWVGHGVGNTPDLAQYVGEARIPEGYVVTYVEITRRGVDPKRIHPHWVNTEEPV